MRLWGVFSYIDELNTRDIFMLDPRKRSLEDNPLRVRILWDRLRQILLDEGVAQVYGVQGAFCAIPPLVSGKPLTIYITETSNVAYSEMLSTGLASMITTDFGSRYVGEQNVRVKLSSMQELKLDDVLILVNDSIISEHQRHSSSMAIG